MITCDVIEILICLKSIFESFILPLFFSLKYAVCFFTSAANIQMHYTRFYHAHTTMNPDQTATLEQSDMGPYCLQYRLPINISRQEKQTTKVVSRRK